MTRKDFELIAGVLRSLKPFVEGRMRLQRMQLQAQLRLWEEMVKLFAERLEEGNPNFQQEKFLKACGYN